MIEAQRPDPDALLAALKKKQIKKRGGKLYLFLGMAPGVGKTYAMLLAAHEAKKGDIDIVVGVVETHGRSETQVLLEGLEIIPKTKIEYRDIQLQEMDIDAILKRKPKIAVIDELAHTNVPGSRHSKRWQDVFELLDAGIDVFSTLNIQHLDSRKESVEQIAGIRVHETVPDSVLDRAHQIRLIDLSPPDLLKRLKDGKVYLGEKAELAGANFFKEDRLTALREIALRLVAEKVDIELQSFAAEREAGVAWPVVERLMVSIGRSQNSEQLIRTTRRMAFNLEAPWIAVYVDTAKILTDTEKKTIAKNIELARNLGAEIITITDTNLPSALTRIAKQKNVTQMVLARPRFRFLKRFSESGYLLQKLMRSNVNLTIVGEEPEKKSEETIRFFDHFRIRSPLGSYAKALLAMLLLTGLNALAVSWIGYRAVGFIFLMGTLILALFAPLGPILLAAAFTALVWDYFFIPPTGTLYIRDYEDVFMFVSYLIATLTAGILAWQTQKHKEILASREARSHMLYKTVWDIATLSNKEAMINAVLDRLQEYLGGTCDVTLMRRDHTLRPFTGQRLTFAKIEREMAVAKWCIDNNKPAGWSTETLSAAEALYIPLKGTSEKIGVMAFLPKRKTLLSPQDADLLFTVARQLAVSLEREAFRERSTEIGRLQETEKLHRVILNLVTEEMRSPLSVIVQAATLLGDDDQSIHLGRKKELAEHLLNAVERLNFSVDNLLSMSRLVVGINPLDKKIIDIKELIDLSRKYIERSLSHHHLEIKTELDGADLLVDKQLCKQVLANILMNAAEYSPKGSKIEIEVTKDDFEIQIAISDNGPGVKEDELRHIFDKFYRIPGTKGVGVGLGLAVAKGIIKAHGGKIAVTNRPTGGATFVLSLPTQ